MNTEVAGAITLAIAVLGAVLGVLNTWNAINTNRVRLRVTPKWSIAQGWTGLSIEVVNLSAFAITINEVGFTIGRSWSRLPKRIPIPADAIVQGIPCPVTLQRREVLNLVFDPGSIGNLDIRRAYALAASGELVKGNSGALKQFRRRGNQVL